MEPGDPSWSAGRRSDGGAPTRIFALPVPDALDEARFLAVLDQEERARAARFRRARDRSRFVVAHAMLRFVIAQTLETRPDQLCFRIGAHGRPALEPATLRFSLADSGDAVLVAIRAGGDIGVDVEAHRPLPDLEGLLRVSATTTERAILDGLDRDERLLAFFDLWTRKEALAKALGLGLSLPLSSTEAPEGLVRVRGQMLRIDQLRLWPGFSAALARSAEREDDYILRVVPFARLKAGLAATSDAVGEANPRPQ